MKKESHNAEMKKTLLIYLFVFLGFFVCFGSFIAQTINPWSINPVISLNTSGNDVPFGVDSSYVYLKQDGEHLRSSRVSNPEYPGIPEKVSIVAIRDDAWDELGEIQHVCIDDARGFASSNRLRNPAPRWRHGLPHPSIKTARTLTPKDCLGNKINELSFSQIL